MPDLDIEPLYRRYFPIIRAKCARMLGDSEDAQDVAQETFTRLWSERSRLTGVEGVLAWLYQTSTRLAIDRFRRARRTAHDGAEALLADQEGADSTQDLQRLVGSRKLLARVAAGVPAAELEVAVLSRVDALTHREIAEVVGASERTVRRLLHKFEARIDRLREDLPQ